MSTNGTIPAPETRGKTRRQLTDEFKALTDEAASLHGKDANDWTDADIERRDILKAHIPAFRDALAKHGEDNDDLGRMSAEAKAWMNSPNRLPSGAGGGTDGAALRRGDVRMVEPQFKSLGERLIESAAYKGYAENGRQKKTAGIEFEDLFLGGSIKATFTQAGATVTGYDRQPGMIVIPLQRLTIADLMPNGQTTLPTVRYFQEDTYTNAATAVAEEGLKPEASFDTSEADAAVRKIGVVGRVSDELFEDFPAMRDYIDMRLRFMVAEREEALLLNGNGTAPNIRGILQTSGIQTEAVGTISATTTVMDGIHRAITKIRAVGFFEPDGIVVHPTDYQIMRLTKDANHQYYGGGPFTGAYGNGGVSMQPGIWGLRTVVTTAISAGTALVGAFGLGAMVFRRSGVNVDITNTDGNDFSYNRTAIRVEERLALAVWRPKAFCTVTGIAAA